MGFQAPNNYRLPKPVNKPFSQHVPSDKDSLFSILIPGNARFRSLALLTFDLILVNRSVNKFPHLQRCSGEFFGNYANLIPNSCYFNNPPGYCLLPIKLVCVSFRASNWLAKNGLLDFDWSGGISYCHPFLYSCYGYVFVLRSFVVLVWNCMSCKDLVCLLGCTY